MAMGTDTLPVNRCDHPPRVIASHLFNRNPLPIEIQGVRRAHRSLFARLDRLEDPKARVRAFREYMVLVFQVGKWRKESSPLGRRSLRNSYLRFLRGWMQDASSPEGAVLKGWVESRFGLPPTFHAGPIADLHAPAYVLYLVERMRESARTNAVESQFDLLYEFVQYELRRRHPGVPAFTLYRGVRNLADYRVLEDPGRNRVRRPPEQPQLLLLPARARVAVRSGSSRPTFPASRSSSARTSSPASCRAVRRSRW